MPGHAEFLLLTALVGLVYAIRTGRANRRTNPTQRPDDHLTHDEWYRDTDDGAGADR